MLLDLREIIEVPEREVSFETTIPAEALLNASVKEYKADPVARGRVFNGAGVLTLEGVVEASMTCICDRCGKEFDSVKMMDTKAYISDGESEDPEAFSLTGDKLDLDEVLTTLYLLDMETKFLCDEDCKGLCSRCGRDLNLGPCGCKKEIDPRFAVLEQLLDK